MVKFIWHEAPVPEKLPVRQVYGVLFTDDGRIMLLTPPFVLPKNIILFENFRIFNFVRKIIFIEFETCLPFLAFAEAEVFHEFGWCIA